MAVLKHKYGRFGVIDTGRAEHKYISVETRINPDKEYRTEYDVIGTHSYEADAKYAAESYSKNSVSLLESTRPKGWIPL